MKSPSPTELALVAAAILVAALFGEVAARLTRSSRPELPAFAGEYLGNERWTNMVPDAQTGWRHRSNHSFEQVKEGHRNLIRANAQGFRSNRDFEAAPESMIALVGDSFTWGSGVNYEDTFGHLLERTMGGPEVYNFAMPGFGVDQVWMSARHHALPRRPDLLVVGFIDQDFDRSLTAHRPGRGNKPRFVLRGDSLEPQRTPGALFLALARSGSELARLVASQTYRFFYTPPDERWVLNTTILEAIADDAHRAGVPVLFLRLPQKSAPRSCSTSWANPCGRGFDRLTRFFEDAGLDFLDLATPEAQVPEDMHLAYDGHLSPNGHRVVASAILAWISGHAPQLCPANATSSGTGCAVRPHDPASGRFAGGDPDPPGSRALLPSPAGGAGRSMRQQVGPPDSSPHT